MQINPDYGLWVDVRVFCRAVEASDAGDENWRTAAGLYGGDLLVDCYEDWVLVEREHLRQQYRKALLALKY